MSGPGPGWLQRKARRLAAIGAEAARSGRERGPASALAALGRQGRQFASHQALRLAIRAGYKHDVPVRGTLFIGYVEAGLGLGESLRGLVSAVAQTPTQFAILPFNLGTETRQTGPFMADRYDLKRRYDVNVIEMAADQLPHLRGQVGERQFSRSYNILRTYWELPEAPAEWADLLAGVDEIWAPSRFVATAFARTFTGPILLVPPCVVVEGAHQYGRDQFGLAPGRFYFMFSFDYFSRPARKNPLAVLRAFQAAFQGSGADVGLLIKSTGAGAAPVPAELLLAAATDARIQMIDRTLSRDEMLSLLRLSDCYVSLHRSEGFGLGMAEAMAFGNIVIGTDYSGSTDFLSSQTGYPVPYTMQPLAPGDYPFGDGQSWAEPDVAAAAAAMRHVFQNQVDARARGQQGAALIRAEFGREHVGTLAARRLGQIQAVLDKARGAAPS